MTDHLKKDDIIEAKNILWDSCSKDLQEKPNRRETSSRSATEAHVHDIIGALNKLDEDEKAPRILLDAKLLSLIPRSRAEEINSISLADRVHQLEAKFATMAEGFDKHVAETTVITDRVHELEKQRPSFAQVVTQPAIPRIQEPQNNPAAPSHNLAPPPSFPLGRGRASGMRGGRGGRGGHTADRRPGGTAHNELQPGKWGSTYSLGGESHKSDTGSGFQYPPHHLKKERQRQQRIIKGKSQAKYGVKGAPEPSRHLFIYRVCHDTDVDGMRELLDNQNDSFTIRDLQCISNDNAMFKSFKLTVPMSEYEALFNENIWPDGIRVRPYRHKKTNNQY